MVSLTYREQITLAPAVLLGIRRLLITSKLIEIWPILPTSRQPLTLILRDCAYPSARPGPVVVPGPNYEPEPLEPNSAPNVVDTQVPDFTGPATSEEQSSKMTPVRSALGVPRK